METKEMNLTAEILEKSQPIDYSKSEITFLINGIFFVMKLVKGGTFMMGAQKRDPNESNYDPKAFDWEAPIHYVTVNDYYIGETLVTQALWQAIMKYTPMPSGEKWNELYGKGDNYPAYNISYSAVEDFIASLNAIPDIKENRLLFRMPTEAEWEFACRGGNLSKLTRYSGSDRVEDVAWFDYISEGKSHPVKEKHSNELGLYDMSGNLFEWCSDWYAHYKANSQVNPKGPETGTRRVLRGGCWNYSMRNCRVSYRLNDSVHHGDSYYGLRLALSVQL